MAKLVKAKDLFVEWLRTIIEEPARTGLSKRHTEATETENAILGQTHWVVSNAKLLNMTLL